MADIFCKENNFYCKESQENGFLNSETEAATGTFLQENNYAPQFVLNPNCNYYNGLRSLSSLRRHKTSRKGQWCHRYALSPPRIPISPYSTLKNEFCSRPLRKCSLRINELAQPRKRQCIETWRYKCDVLPGFMIDRLKQNVMDEKPIAGISDAIDCYKRKRLTNINNTLFNKFTTSQLQKCKNTEELKKMCILFGRNIAIKINAPINVTLNSNLRKISNVVKEELRTLVKKQIDLRQYNNSAMLQEVTNKVTIWIAMILEESSNKIFEETIKDHPKSKKTNHRELITMIQNMVNQDNIRTSSELEEEEGHIVDLIDSVVKEAIEISEASHKKFVDLMKETRNFTRDSTDLNEFRESSVDPTITSECDTEITEVTLKETLKARTSVEDNANMNKNLDSSYNEEDAPLIIPTAEDLKEQLINELDNIIEYVFARPTTESIDISSNDKNNEKTFIDDNNSKPEYDFIVDSNFNDVEQTDDHYDHDNTQNATNSLREINGADVDDVVTVFSLKESIVSLSDENVTIRMIKELIEELVIPNEDEIVDMIAVNINSQDVIDEKNKKVKFSHYFNFDFSVKPHENKQVIKSDSAEETQLEQEQVSWKPSSDYIKPNISFAGPNGLLNEPWPEDVPVSPLKATKSVSKSVLSLGNIIENDDSLEESLDNNIIQHSKKNLLEQLNTQMVKSHISNTEEIDVTPEKAFIAKNYEKENNPLQEWNGSNLQTIDTQSTDPKIKPTITATSRIGTGDQIGLEKQDDIILNAVINKIKQSEPKFIYRIDPTTAPPWVAEDHGDPNVNLQELNRKATQIRNATAIRHWCKSLDHVTKNLDKWSNWIMISCKKVSSLKQQDGKYRNPDVKRQRDEWRKLQKNIDEDFEFLTKLKYRTEKRLKYHLKAKNSQSVENIQHTHFSSGYTHSRNVLELIDEIEKISSWMHRLIVSTEYAVKCKCKKNFIPP